MTAPADLRALLAALPRSLLRDLATTATAGSLLAARIDAELRRREEQESPDYQRRRELER